MGWGVYDYPIPPETSKTIKGEMVVSYKFETEVPKEWDKEEIRDYLETNPSDYLECIEEIIDLDFWEAPYVCK